ncbi:MAG: hypothetical protein L6262_04885 [Weeksellaceae bacterium]|nr:hypothetical protein [Weeksellaceae bacterium]
MRKKLKLLFILLISLFYKSQDNSLAAAVNTPVSYQTGVPDISFPLTSLPAAKDFNINFGLAYNANAYKNGSYSGLIAKNWALTGSNFTITRKIQTSWPDEIETVEYWDDTYYYNINGEQGSFKFQKSGIFPNEIYKIIKLTPSNLTIESQRIVTTGSWQPRIVESFKVTDSKGYKYYFTEHDQSRLTYSIGINGTTAYPIMDLRNTFYATRVDDALNRTVATFQNKQYIKYKSGSTTVIEALCYLPETVTTAYGKIVFEHGDSNTANYNFDFPLQDRYFIKSITLKDHKDKFVSKSSLNINSSHDYMPPTASDAGGDDMWFRTLGGINRVNRDNVVFDRINFGSKIYTNTPYGTAGATDASKELLDEIRFSSGKKIEYNFGFTKSKSTIDFNDPAFIPYLQDPHNFVTGISQYTDPKYINIDTKIPNGRKYILLPNMFLYPYTKISIGLTVTERYTNGNTENPSLGGGDLPEVFEYRLVDPTTGQGTTYKDDTEAISEIITPGHNYYLEISGTGGKGFFSIIEKTYKQPPYENNFILSELPVVQDVKFYDIAENTHPSNAGSTYDLKKSISYDYNLFDGSGFSSGTPSPDQESVLIYKNIKVTESDKPGYTKYYFKTFGDYPSYVFNSISVFPNFNLIKNGLLEKKEVHDIDNNIQQQVNYNYSLPPYDESQLYLYQDSGGGMLYTQESFFDRITTTDISKDLSGNSLTDISEKTFNQANNNLMSEKSVSADGTISETTYKYAAEKANSKLLNAGMTSVPLEVTQKQNNVQIGKLETKYDQTGNYFPSSVQSFGINNVITGEQTNEYYDDMGNVLQTRSKSGMPTAVIWGYGRTQPIAKIEGGEYFNILALMGQTDAGLLDIVQKSNADIDDASEQLLRNALEAFRKKPGFKNYLITTYTYDPLIGIKSVTTPNGMTEYYYYDNQNRMIRLEDMDHHIIKENKYEQNVFQD